MRAGWRDVLLFLGLALTMRGAETHPILAIGSPAPDFALPGVDGQIHRLADYATDPVLVIVFTCNHCPIAQQYEQRIQQLYDDYRGKGVAVVAIEPNAPDAIRIDELDSTDMSDTLAEMKLRVAFKHLSYPYLYDGATQAVARAYGPQATPHVFIFDRTRRLRYEGRIDNSYRIEMVKTHEARDAIDALLAGKPVAVTHTGVFGCSTKWKEKEAERIAALIKLDAKPVKLDLATPADLESLRANAGKKLTLVAFWSTRCERCVSQLADWEATYEMYSARDFDLVTVATDPLNERAAVEQILKHRHISTRNLLLPSGETAALARTFDPQWQPATPYLALVKPDGSIVHGLSSLDILELRRAILANIVWEYDGFGRYWTR